MGKRLLFIIGLSLSLPMAASAKSIVTEGNVLAGPGFGGFTSGIGDQTGVGPSWELRAGVVLARFFGFELNYQGLNSLLNNQASLPVLLPSNASFMSNQITADVVPGIPFVIHEHELRPYALLGVGYARVGASDAATPIVDATGVNAVAVPVGGGISYNLTHHFMIDGRFSYNFLNTAGGNTWNVGLNLGASFGT